MQIVENLDKNELRSFLTKLQNILKSEYIIPYDLIKVVYNLPLIGKVTEAKFIKPI